MRREDGDVELTYKAGRCSEGVRVDVGLVVGECRVVGDALLQRDGHTFNGPKAPPEAWFNPKIVWARVQKRSVQRWVLAIPSLYSIDSVEHSQKEHISFGHKMH